ncbi:phosphatidylinositol kinase (PIK-5) [Thraustotheca clavata]|uniref:non-specific serine/threonine protein kinase n=1 Tax=Thraustotheca clavata TaxID=74557 RepID=A0A1W0AAZ6_9STRA|nr:phosphatidylinositol kinase (PIK-5) [Thraustotheca clavata]
MLDVMSQWVDIKSTLPPEYEASLNKFILTLEKEINDLTRDKESMANMEERMRAQARKAQSVITLNVGGVKFATSKENLLRLEGSLFHAMLTSEEWQPNAQGEYFIDVDPQHFGRVMKLIRTGELYFDGLCPQEKHEFRWLLDYFQLQEPHATAWSTKYASDCIEFSSDLTIAIKRFSRYLWSYALGDTSTTRFTVQIPMSHVVDVGFTTMNYIKSEETQLGWFFRSPSGLLHADVPQYITPIKKSTTFQRSSSNYTVVTAIWDIFQHKIRFQVNGVDLSDGFKDVSDHLELYPIIRIGEPSSQIQLFAEVWGHIRKQCRMLRMSKKKADRKRELHALDEMLTLSSYQDVLHRSGTWGYVVAQIFNVIEEDLLEMTKKRTKTMELTQITVLFHALDNAKDALDRNVLGIDTLRRLIQFGELGINDEAMMDTPAERHCYYLLDKLIAIPSYCRLADSKLLSNVLDRVLTHLHLGTAVEHHTMCASIARHVIQHMVVDFHPHLHKYMLFFEEWFKAASKPSDVPIALNLLSCLVLFMKEYPNAMASLVVDTSALSYVHRLLPTQIKAMPMEISLFLIHYYQLHPSSNVENLCLAFLEPSTMNAVFQASFSLARQTAISTNTPSTAVLDASMLGEKAIAWYSMIADIVWMHDAGHGKDNGTEPAAKRIKMLSALDTILNYISEDTSANSSNLSGMETMSFTQRRQMTQYDSGDVRRLPWLFLLYSLVTRHGHKYQQDYHGVWIRIQQIIASTLGNPSMDNFCREITYNILTVLVLRSIQRQDWINDAWLKTLGDITRRKPKEAVIQFLAACVAVPNALSTDIIAENNAALCEALQHIPFYLSTITLTTALHTVVDGGLPTALLRDTLIQGLQSSSAITSNDSMLLLILGIGLCSFCDVMIPWNIAPYLISPMWSQFILCGTGVTLPKMFDIEKAQDMLPYIAKLFSELFPVKNSVKCNGRVELPSFTSDRILRSSAIFVSERECKVFITPLQDTSIEKSRVSVLQNGIHSLLHENTNLLPTLGLDELAETLCRLLDVGIVLASAIGLHLELQHIVEGSQLLNQIFTACSKRLPQLLKKKHYQVGIFQRLYSILLLLQGSQLFGFINYDATPPKVKIPPSCRVATRDIATILEAYVLSGANEVLDEGFENEGKHLEVSSEETSSPSTSDVKCRVWSMRIILLLKNSDSSCHLLKSIVEQNYITSTEALELIPALCHPLTIEGARIAISLIKQSTKLEPELAATQLLNLGHFVKGALPRDLLNEALSILEYMGRKFAKQNRKLRKYLVSTWETWYLVEAEIFGGFVDFNMLHLVDLDTSVRCASLLALQTVYSKFEGTDAIYSDVYTHLQTHQADSPSFILACYVASCKCPSLLPLVLAQYVENGREDDLVIKTVEALSSYHGYESPWKMCMDQLWGIMRHYLDLDSMLKVKADSPQESIAEFAFSVFDRSLYSFTSAFSQNPELSGHLLPFLVLVDSANNTTSHVKTLKRCIPTIKVPDALTISAKIIMTHFLANEPIDNTQVTPDVFRNVCEIGFNLLCFTPTLKSKLSWANLSKLCTSNQVLDVVLCFIGLVGEYHLDNAKQAPLRCLCDCIEASGSNYASNVLAQRLILHCLLQNSEKNLNAAKVLKMVVERFSLSDPDAFGLNLNMLVRSIIPLYATVDAQVRSLFDTCLVSVSLHPKLHKNIAGLDPIPLHISSALDQLASTSNSTSRLGESLISKLTRSPLDTIPFSSFGLKSLQEVISIFSNENTSNIATVVYGLLSQAYASNNTKSTSKISTITADSPEEMISLSQPSQQLNLGPMPSQSTLLRRSSSHMISAENLQSLSCDVSISFAEFATCLGHLGGIFPASSLQLDPAALNTMYHHVYHRPSLMQLQTYKDGLLEVKAKVLEYIVGELFGQHPTHFTSAIKTLRTLLSLPIVQDIVRSSKSLPHGVKTFLSLIPLSEQEKLTPIQKIPCRNWASSEDGSFDIWLNRITLQLISNCDDLFIQACAPMATCDSQFTVLLFPLALYATLLGNHVTREITTQIEAVLNSQVPLEHGQMLVHSFQYVATLEKLSLSTHVANMLQLPWLDVARMALRCKVPYSAFQFTEYYVEKKHKAVKLVEPELVSLLRQIYDAIGDLDAMNGVLDIPQLTDQAQSYAMEMKFQSSLPLYDAALRVNPSSTQLLDGMAAALNTLGYTNLLQSMLVGKSGLSSSAQPTAFQYELAWKAMQWNLKSEVNTFEGCVYGCLRGLASNEPKIVKSLLRRSKTSILQSQRLSFTGFESTKGLQSSMVQFETLVKLERVLAIQKLQQQQRLLGATTNDFQNQQRELLNAWKERHIVYSADTDAYIHVLDMEETLFNILNWSEYLPEWHIKRAKAARKANRPAIAFSALSQLENIESTLSFPMKVQTELEKAHIYYEQGDTSRALLVTKQLHRHLLQTKTEPLLLARVQLTIGKWLAFMKAERNEVIQNEYLIASTAIFEQLNPEINHGREAAKAYLTVANYLFENYHQVKSRVESNEWKRGKQVALAQEKELRACEELPDSARYQKHIVPLKKQVEYDKAERQIVENSVLIYLKGALRNYGLSLRYAPYMDMTPVFRIISLWFQHGNDPSVNEEMDSIVESVPSYKIIPLSYQILSRLASSVSLPQFHSVLEALVLRLCVDHPHHTIVQLLALKNTGKHGNMQFRENVGSGKAEAAAQILKRVQLHNSTTSELVQNMEALCDAYVKLALFDTQEFVRKGIKKIAFSNVVVGKHNVPFDQCLRLRRLNQDTQARPAVLTLSIAPRSDRDYTNVPRVQSFESTFTITDTGIHRPKIIYCFGSDGIRRKQLVKGNDDTRQDLVIEQTFEMVNTFLSEQQSTNRRRLRIKTYKVTPLGPVAGVLEWVDNTMPIGNYLTGRGMDAHSRHHPNEWKHPVCRQYLQRSTDKYRAFLDIQANFTPVFHHFFLEKYPDPAIWYARRVAYTRSAAVTSIVGHILGIGDRHSSNILIDEATGELVHIDFGVVFDQGMALQTPETVPFRLTRDLVDGMGITGVDGLFTRTCEETLQVLRKKGTALTTILEVFIHDPLYNWTLSPIKALRMQQENQLPMTKSSDVMPEENLADAASRALLRVKQKLQGYEDPAGDAMSVQGQVQRLIHVARDPHNLCKLFPGWGPWL